MLEKWCQMFFEWNSCFQLCMKFLADRLLLVNLFVYQFLLLTQCVHIMFFWWSNLRSGLPFFSLSWLVDVGMYDIWILGWSFGFFPEGIFANLLVINFSFQILILYEYKISFAVKEINYSQILIIFLLNALLFYWKKYYSGHSLYFLMNRRSFENAFLDAWV